MTGQERKKEKSEGRYFFLVYFLTLSLILVFCPVQVRADDTSSNSSIDSLVQQQQNTLSDKQGQLDNIKAKIKAYRNIVDLKQKQGAALSDQIEGLDAQIQSLELQIATNKKNLSDLDREIALLAERIKQKEELIQTQRDLLSEMVRNYSADQENFVPVRFVTQATNIADPFQQDDWSIQTGERVQEILSSLRSLRAGLVTEQSALADKRKQSHTLKLQLEQQNDYLQSTKESKQMLLSKTQSEAQKYDSLVDDLEQQRAAIETEIESLEAGKIDVLNTNDLPEYQEGLLAYPLKSIAITQKYGVTSFAKASGFYGKSNFHNGVDFAATTGTSIYAAGDGKVVAIGDNGRYAYGRYIALDHGNGLITMYGHLSEYKKKVGDHVYKGEMIAKSGDTGNVTGPHLHFTVFAAKSFDVVPSKVVPSVTDIPVGATVDPLLYLP